MNYKDFPNIDLIFNLNVRSPQAELYIPHHRYNLKIKTIIMTHFCGHGCILLLTKIFTQNWCSHLFLITRSICSHKHSTCNNNNSPDIYWEIVRDRGVVYIIMWLDLTIDTCRSQEQHSHGARKMPRHFSLSLRSRVPPISVSPPQK